MDGLALLATCWLAILGPVLYDPKMCLEEISGLSIAPRLLGPGRVLAARATI